MDTSETALGVRSAASKGPWRVLILRQRQKRVQRHHPCPRTGVRPSGSPRRRSGRQQSQTGVEGAGGCRGIAGWERARTQQCWLQQERLFWVGKEHVGGSWGQELPFPRETRNNGASSARGQRAGFGSWSPSTACAGRTSRRCPTGRGGCREHAGPEVVVLERNFPPAPRETPAMRAAAPRQRDPVLHGSTRAGAAGLSSQSLCRLLGGGWTGVQPPRTASPTTGLPVCILGSRSPHVLHKHTLFSG